MWWWRRSDELITGGRGGVDEITVSRMSEQIQRKRDSARA